MELTRRYQAFISSTFTDLIRERQAVLKAVLEVGHMPAGMELFPASDDTAWDLIKSVIDSSDYYVLIIGARYGSRDSNGIGFTEKEYRYAVSTDKPVIPLLHQNPEELMGKTTDTDEGAWELLQRFRAAVEEKHTCAYWNTAEELRASTVLGLLAAARNSKAVGWIRASEVPTDAAIADVLKLREQVTNLQEELERRSVEAPPGTQELQQGDDTFHVDFTFSVSYQYPLDDQYFQAGMDVTWDEMFSGVAPTLINECTDEQLRSAFHRTYVALARVVFHDDENVKAAHRSNFVFNSDQLDTCLIQLRALGLIRESDRKRSVRDTTTYWALTEHGDYRMVQLRAQRRDGDDRKRTISRNADGPASLGDLL